MKPTLGLIRSINREIAYLRKKISRRVSELPSFTPHQAQIEVLDTANRNNALCMGRRWGKTELAIWLLIEIALAGYPVAWFAPTYRSLSDVWYKFTDILAPVITKQSFQERRIELNTGGVIEFWSLDQKPDLVRGRAYRRVVIDEAAMIRNLKKVFF